MLNLLLADPKRQVLDKEGAVHTNTYQAIAEDGVVPQGDVVLTVQQLELLPQITGQKALFVSVDHSPEDHQFPLDQLDAIFIDFPAFADGRGYSFAALLRRQGYQGELRAVGDVFKDVLNYLKRSGFDRFILKEGKDIQEAIAGLNDFTHPYQFSTAHPEQSYQGGVPH